MNRPSDGPSFLSVAGTGAGRAVASRARGTHHLRTTRATGARARISPGLGTSICGKRKARRIIEGFRSAVRVPGPRVHPNGSSESVAMVFHSIPGASIHDAAHGAGVGEEPPRQAARIVRELLGRALG